MTVENQLNVLICQNLATLPIGDKYKWHEQLYFGLSRSIYQIRTTPSSSLAQAQARQHPWRHH